MRPETSEGYARMAVVLRQAAEFYSGEHDVTPYKSSMSEQLLAGAEACLTQASFLEMSPSEQAAQVARQAADVRRLWAELRAI